MTLDLTPAAVTDRLRTASRLSDLSPLARLDAKLDLSPEGVTRRLREASQLLRLCQALAAANPERR